MLRVVRACSDDNLDAQALGELVSKDPVLVMELLRIANSAYFGFSNEISSVAHAVAIIGQRTLCNIALYIPMKEAIKPQELPSFSLTSFGNNLCGGLYVQSI